jgi:hypothetical protein
MLSATSQPLTSQTTKAFCRRLLLQRDARVLVLPFPRDSGRQGVCGALAAAPEELAMTAVGGDGGCGRVLYAYAIRSDLRAWR